MADVPPELQLKFLLHMMERSCRHADALGETFVPLLFFIIYLSMHVLLAETTYPGKAVTFT
jgi:uncharacterized membrane protein YozB (DUF420 family)